MAFIILLLIIALVYVFIKINELKRSLDALYKKLLRLENHIKSLEKGAISTKEETIKPGDTTAAPVPVTGPPPDVKVKPPDPQPIRVATADDLKKKKPEVPSPETVRVPSQFQPIIITPKTPQASKPPSEFWTNVEKQFAENWTGILGAIIMVMGVGFAGLYAALVVSPFFRFLMISAFAALLGGIFYYLKPKPKWIKLALWLRSSAGAVFLFGCLGSGGIPGLQWIESPLYALLLLLAGIATNLYLGIAGGRQVFASLHVLLSLVALSIAPQTATTFVIAAVVSVFGIALAYREKWDYHLLLTISTFFIYHIFWYFKAKSNGFDFQLNLLGIFTVILVSLSAAFVHYREAYSTRQFAPLPFTVHLINWLYFGLGLFLHVTDSKWKTIFIALGSIAAFFLARRARKLEIRWLYLTDTLVAQATAVIAILSLSRWDVEIILIIAILFIESLIYAIIMLKEGEEPLYRIGTYLLHLISIVLIAYGFLQADYENMNLLYKHASVLFLCAVLGTAFHIYTLQQPADPFNPIDYWVKPASNKNKENKAQASAYSILAILTGLMIIVIYTNIYQISWSEYIVAFIAVGLVFLRQKFQSNSLGIGDIIMLIGLHGVNWVHLQTETATAPWEQFVEGFPFLLLSLSAVKWSYLKSIEKHITWIGIYMFALQGSILIYIIFNPISPFIPGVLWLILSLAALESAAFLRNKYLRELEFRGEPDRYLLHIGYAAILAFLARHVLVHLQSDIYLGLFKIRFLIELFALLIFIYWAAHKKPLEGKLYKSWIYLHPLFIELILLFSILTVSIEIDAFWHPITWMGFAFIGLVLGRKLDQGYSRLRFYSLILAWAAAFQLAFLTSSYVTPSLKWYDQGWLTGAAAIVLQFIYLYYFYHYGELGKVSLPAAMNFLGSWVGAVNRRKTRWIFYPVIICVAIFLYWSFDKSILTLLWVIQCFLIFVLSILLREKQFRYVALTGVVLCVGRLIFYDLAQTGTLTRAMVFLGVGITMLIMNSVYNKYKHKFGDE